MSLESVHRSVVQRETGHTPVLLHEVEANLAIRPDDCLLDATLGGAGHAKALARLLGAKGIFIGIDADRGATLRAQEALKDVVAKIFLIEGNFRNVESYLGKHGIPHLTKALFDLGWSGYQLTAGRGFSFLEDEPLLMTYADTPTEHTLTAETIVNTWKAESIADVIYGWGRGTVFASDRQSHHRGPSKGPDPHLAGIGRDNPRRRAGILSERTSASGNEDVPGTPHRGQRRARRA